MDHEREKVGRRAGRKSKGRRVRWESKLVGVYIRDVNKR